MGSYLSDWLQRVLIKGGQVKAQANIIHDDPASLFLDLRCNDLDSMDQPDCLLMLQTCYQGDPVEAKLYAKHYFCLCKAKFR